MCQTIFTSPAKILGIDVFGFGWLLAAWAVIGVAMLAWPELPKIPELTMSERERKRWDALDEGSRQDIERLRDYAKQTASIDVEDDDPSFPVGEFFGSGGGERDKLW